MYRYTLYCLLILTTIISCKSFDFNEDIELVSDDATYAIPLFKTQVKLTDLFDGTDSLSELTVLPNDEMVLKYFGNLGRKTVNEIFQNIPPIPYTAVDTFNTIELVLGNNNLILTQALLKAGTISFSYVSEHDEDVSVEFQIDELTKDGAVYSYTLDAAYSGGSTAVSVLDLPVAGYSLNIIDNEMHMRYIATKASGERDTVSLVNMLINGLEFTYMEGYWGSDFFNVERDTIVIDVFEDLLGGSLFFTDPKVTVTVQNSFGFPVRSKVEVAEVISSDGTALALESVFVDEGFDMAYPTLQEVGQVKNTYFAFDNINSNIDDIIGSSPRLFDYEFDGLANPDDDPTIIGFMTDSSFFEIKVAVELPLGGYAQDFTLEKDFDVDFEQFDNVRWVELKVVSSNSIPFTIDGQMYFLDDQDNIIDSTFAQVETLVQGAAVNSLGYSDVPSEGERFILLDEAKFENIRSSQKLRLKTFLKTSGGQNIPVNFTNQDYLDIRVGMKLGVKDL